MDTKLKEISASQEHLKEEIKVNREMMIEEKETAQMEMKSIAKCHPRWRPQYTSPSPSQKRPKMCPTVICEM
jgi:hypothetical protein